MVFADDPKSMLAKYEKSVPSSWMLSLFVCVGDDAVEKP